MAPVYEKEQKKDQLSSSLFSNLQLMGHKKKKKERNLFYNMRICTSEKKSNEILYQVLQPMYSTYERVIRSEVLHYHHSDKLY